MPPPTTSGADLCRVTDAVSCELCGLYGFLRLLTQIDPGGADSEPLAGVLSRRVPVGKGEALCRAGQEAHAIYAVKSGAFVTSTPLTRGEMQVLAFHLPGELVGLDALAPGRYPNAVRALVPSSVCQLELGVLEGLGVRRPEVQSQLIQALSGQLAEQERLAMLGSRPHADARLAAFLIYMSERYSIRGLPADQMRLPMGRQEIASYLGLAVETVSRTLKRLESLDLAEIRGKRVLLRDLAGLKRLAGVG